VSVELAAVRLDERGEGVLIGVPDRPRSFACALRIAALDGFIAGPNDDHGSGLGDDTHRLHDWMADGTDPGSHRPAGVSGEVFDELMATGAVVVGRRTFELAGGWSGDPSCRAARRGRVALGHVRRDRWTARCAGRRSGRPRWIVHASAGG
jgi:hypothetical protein